MAYLLGALIGGFFITTLVGLLVGLAFKSKQPAERAIRASILGWIFCGILAGFGMADGGPFRFDAIIYYLPGSILAFFYLRSHYGKMWVEADEDEELRSTFE
jgi:Ca2+/Na+ antiporter